MRLKRSSRPPGFVLLDVMLGVAIFTIGILALGSAVNNCLDGQQALREAARARLLLGNRMNEILTGAVKVDAEPDAPPPEETGGITLRQQAEPLEAEDEEGNQVTGLSVVTLVAEWKSGTEPQRSDLTFYILSDAAAPIP